MEAGRRRGTARSGGVIAGSVWETRMKSDEVKGGIKVFNGEENSEEDGDKRVIRPKQSPVGVSGKRKTWKSDNSEGLERSPIQIAKQRYDQSRDLSEQCKELSVSSDGVKKSPVQSKKTRSEVGKELIVSCEGMERSSIRKIKTRSEETVKDLNVFDDRTERNPIPMRKAKSESENGDQTERSSVQLRKVKSESNKALDESIGANEKSPIPLTKAKSGKNLDGLGDGTARNVVELKASKSDSKPKLKSAIDGPSECPDESVEAIEKNSVEIEKTRSDETCKEFGVCEEKVIWSSLSNLGQVKSAPEQAAGDEEEEDWDGESDEEIEIEIEAENKRIEVKEINIPEQNLKQVVNVEKKITEQNLKQFVNVEKKIHQVQERPLPISPILKKLGPPSLNQPRTHPVPTKTKPIPVSNGFQRTPETQTGFQRIPETHSRLQSLVDLVMWRDSSKSAFIFGMGTFIIISSSYARDLNISLISVLSYLGLVYLAAIFLFRSIICRGVIDIDDRSQDYVVGEEEAVWLLQMVLPYLNEFLLKLRALFSGDPATTMKLAVLLFVLARCGSSITIWKMAKLGFFGVFTVPKICSSYSTQLKAYGTFWIGRFKDAWESCSHKKAVAFGIFTLVWNLSSVVARVWAVFMLYVAFRYYHQSVMGNDWVEQEPRPETSWQRQIGVQRRVRGPTTTVEVNNKKDKKRLS